MQVAALYSTGDLLGLVTRFLRVVREVVSAENAIGAHLTSR